MDDKNKANMEVKTYDIMRPHLSLQLIRQDRADIDLIENYPMWKILDFYVVPIINYGLVDGVEGGAVLKVDNGIMKSWGVEQGQLFGDAMNNVENNTVIKASGEMNDMLRKDAEKKGEEYEELDMVCMTNKDAFYGSCSFLNIHAMIEIAKDAASPLYVIPSSVHEILCIPITELKCNVKTGKAKISTYIREVNEEKHIGKEYLSDHVYLFGRDSYGRWNYGM
ncbi:MAG: DUF5688 family protein [Clostridiales bacterium]|nr:DUF5688 family protein [Clostridiales bacterium]